MSTSLAATAALALIFLVACDQADVTPALQDPNVGANAGLKIGYVNTDSILTGYVYLKDQADILDKRQVDASANFERKARKLQDQIESFQRRAQGGNLTPKQMEGEQSVLGRSQQELQMEEQRLTMELQGEAARIQAELSTVLKREVEAIQQEEGYDFILQYGGGGGVLAVNPSYDLTSQILTRMNAKPGGAPSGGDTTADR